MFLKYNYFKLSSIVLIELLGLFIYLLIDSVLDKYKVSEDRRIYVSILSIILIGILLLTEYLK